jgi:hypothetical protein
MRLDFGIIEERRDDLVPALDRSRLAADRQRD